MMTERDRWPKPKGAFDRLAAGYEEAAKSKLTLNAVPLEVEWHLTPEREALLRFLKSTEEGPPTPTCSQTVYLTQVPDHSYRGYVPRLGAQDVFYGKPDEDELKKDLAEILQHLRLDGRPLSPGRSEALRTAFRLFMKYYIEEIKPGTRKEAPRGVARITEAELLPNIRSQLTQCLPIPAGELLEWRSIESGAAWQTLLSVSKVFGGPRAPLVLITGPPGSGKEGYARAVHYGAARNIGKELQVLSLAEVGSLDDLRKELARRIESLCGNSSGESLLVPAHESQRRAAGSLFIDEVDKARDPLLRSALLRLFEDRQFECVSGEHIDCREVFFICAAGSSLEGLRSIGPPDFWTRMEAHVPVHDPLLASSQKERETILKDFFLFFWWDLNSDAAERHIIGLPSGRLEKTGDNRIDLKLAKLEKLFRASVGRWDTRALKLIASDVSKEAKEHFASVLAPHLERRSLSLRGVRSATFAIAVALQPIILALSELPKPEKIPASSKDRYLKRIHEVVHDAVGTVLQVLPPDSH